MRVKQEADVNENDLHGTHDQMHNRNAYVLAGTGITYLFRIIEALCQLLSNLTLHTVVPMKPVR